MDAESKLLVSLVQGPSRDQATADRLVEDFAQRTDRMPPELVTTDEHAPYKKALMNSYGVEYRPRRRSRRGRKCKLQKRWPAGMVYATVHKTRERGRVVDVSTKVVHGTQEALTAALEGSRCSTSVNTSFVERHNGTTRHFNARKQRKTYCFSKQLCEHVAMSWLAATHYNFCWAHRTLRVRVGRRQYRQRCPAMAAGLTNQMWTVNDLLSRQVHART